jgi:hypothetical protein
MFMPSIKSSSLYWYRCFYDCRQAAGLAVKTVEFFLEVVAPNVDAMRKSGRTSYRLVWNLALLANTMKHVRAHHGRQDRLMGYSYSASATGVQKDSVVIRRGDGRTEDFGAILQVVEATDSYWKSQLGV